MYTSTRRNLSKHVSECITKGISEEGGLFICSDFNKFKMSKDLGDLSYQDLTKYILEFFLDDFSKEAIKEIVNKAYNEVNFRNKIVETKHFNELSFLELYHGPTMAFKDMALTILPHLMIASKKISNHHKKTLILTATSGDTGGAALSGFKGLDDIKIIVLYPTKGVSKFQEKQMHYYTGTNAQAIAVEGNFDDCQNLVKKIFTSNISLKNLELSSANSINIGRLIPQIIYYFYSYFEMIKSKQIKYGEKINYVVPTGNFGNILACYIAKQMGLPIEKIVCASNENKVLTDFFNTLEYNRNRQFHLTNSPAMDILISSNLERLLYLISNNDKVLVSQLMKDLKEQGKFILPNKYQDKLNDFLACAINNEETIKYIEEVFRQYNYLIDPHTAVAYGAYVNCKEKLAGKTVIVSTASPFKFLETVDEIFKTGDEGIKQVESVSKITNTQIPSVLHDIYNSTFKKQIWTKDNMENNLKELIGELDEKC